MRIEKREKTVYEEIYIADDGTQFDTERHCLNYEKEIKMQKNENNAEKLRVHELDDLMPLIDTETYEDHEYVWYKLESEKDFNTLKEAFEYSKDFTVPDGYPTFYCVESFGYDNIYAIPGGENMTFDETDFAKRVPKKILDRTKENMEVYNMGLYAL